MGAALPELGQALRREFRISDLGPEGNAEYDAADCAVAYNSRANQYLVVWEGDDDTAPLVNGESEIFGQRLSDTGGQVGANDFRVSEMGPDGDFDYAAGNPALAYNPRANQYLVAWQGEDDRGALVDDEIEIFAPRLSAKGARRGANDFRVSDMGPDGDADYDGADPAVAWNGRARSYLVAWQGDDDTAPLVDDDRAIFGQQLSASGAVRGRNDVRISHMGPVGNAGYQATDVAVASQSKRARYFVAWHADDDTGALAIDELEVWARRAAASPCTHTGTPGRDVLRGTRRADVICGLGGNDRLQGRRGKDRVFGGVGNDRLVGGRGGDRLYGQRGRDTLLASGGGSDLVDGGRGPDRASVDARDMRRSIERLF